MAKKILITGGVGFIGTNFVYYAAAHADFYEEIVVLDKLTYAGNKKNIEPLITSGRVRFVQGDVADKAFIFSLFEKEKFDLIVHFAAETHVDRSIQNPDPFVVSNILGTYILLEAAKKYSVPRFHHISTDEVYGDTDFDSKEFFTELSPTNPHSPYSASKASSDSLVLAYHATYGMFTTISRCSNNYGPYQFPEKLIPYFFHLAQNNKPVPLYGEGKNIRDWLYVEDHCEAVDLILKKGKKGEIYNIGGSTHKQNREVAEMIIKFLGKPLSLITKVQDRPGHDRRYALDASKIHRELGWQPKTSFEEGIAKTFEWYKKNTQWLAAGA